MFISQFTAGVAFTMEPGERTDISNFETLLVYVKLHGNVM
jgi:hypothetical protein